MTKEEFLVAVNAGKHLVLHWNDASQRWSFYELGRFVEFVLHKEYRDLAQRIGQAQHQFSREQANKKMEERIRYIGEKLEAAGKQTGIAFLQVEDGLEIFGYWLVIPLTHDQALRIVETQCPAASIHIQRQSPNITILPNDNAN